MNFSSFDEDGMKGMGIMSLLSFWLPSSRTPPPLPNQPSSQKYTTLTIMIKIFPVSCMPLIFLGLFIITCSCRLLNMELELVDWVIYTSSFSRVTVERLFLLELYFDQALYFKEKNGLIQPLDMGSIDIHQLEGLVCLDLGNSTMMGMQSYIHENDEELLSDILYISHFSIVSRFGPSKPSNYMAFMFKYNSVFESGVVTFMKSSLGTYICDSKGQLIDPQEVFLSTYSRTSFVWVNLNSKFGLHQKEHCIESIVDERSSFIQESANLFGGPLLKPIMEKALKSIADMVTHRVETDSQADVTINLHHSILAGAMSIVEDVTHAVGRNVTHLLSDTIPFKLTERFPVTLANELGPLITEMVLQRVKDPLFISVHDVLREAITENLQLDITEALGRSLPIILTKNLTRTVSYSLTPTLVIGMSHTLDQNEHCASCFHQNTECSLCQYSIQRLHYINYISTYYSVYYLLISTYN